LQAATIGVPDKLPEDEHDGSLVGVPTASVLTRLQRNDSDE
jgi:hypothetical protein